MKTPIENPSKPLKIVLAGGSGFLGQTLIRHFSGGRVTFINLSRKKNEQLQGATTLWWDGENKGAWCNELENADLLINLSGKSVDCRYTEKNKQAIFDSRLKSTAILGEAIKDCKTPPKLWINCASATIYRHTEDRDMDETTGEIGAGFSVEVCKQWEKVFENSICPRTRKIVLRISMVMGRTAGVLPVLLSLAKKGMAGTMGNGKQYMSWIHETDFAGIIEACILHEDWSGAFNCSAPTPIPNKEFMKIIRKAAGVPFGIPAPEWLLEIGAFFMRTEVELMLKSRRVVPGRLLKNGFVFRYNTVQAAISDLTKKQ